MTRILDPTPKFSQPPPVKRNISLLCLGPNELRNSTVFPLGCDPPINLSFRRFSHGISCMWSFDPHGLPLASVLFQEEIRSPFPCHLSNDHTSLGALRISLPPLRWITLAIHSTRIRLKVCAPRFCCKVCALPCYSMVDWLIDWVNVAWTLFPFFVGYHPTFRLHFCFIRSTSLCLKVGWSWPTLVGLFPRSVDF